jgi:hypothetical protein
VLGYHAPAPALSIKHEPISVEAVPARRASAKAKSLGRKVWSTVTRPFARPINAAEPR